VLKKVAAGWAQGLLPKFFALPSAWDKTKSLLDAHSSVFY
jgi:hypothetical protein